MTELVEHWSRVREIMDSNTGQVKPMVLAYTDSAAEVLCLDPPPPFTQDGDHWATIER